MKLKSLILFVALFVCLPFVTNAQLYVDSLGIVQVGNYVNDIFNGVGDDYDDYIDTAIVLNVKDRNNKWGGKISIGDALLNYNMNVSVGELEGYNGDSDILWLHGKCGLYYTRGNRAQDTVFYCNSSNSFRFNCNVRANNFFVASDSRFKTDITPLESGLQTITSLSPVTYKLLPRFGGSETVDVPTAGLSDKDKRDIEYFNNLYKNQQPDGPYYGFIAQEVKEIYPELVHTDDDGYMYIDYIGMIPLLVNAIGELNTQIEQLKAENSELNQAVINAQSPAVGNSQPSQIADDFMRNTLYQNAPNPFTTSTTIAMSLRSDVTQAVLYVFDMQGGLLKTIPVDDRGNVSVTINGGELNAGMYIYSLVADGNEVASKRMILTK